MPAKEIPTDNDGDSKRGYLKQSEVPSCSLNSAMKIAATIAESYGTKPTAPLKVAKALNLEPGARPFRMTTGASIAYGITEGGYNAEAIAITALGMRILKPKKEGDDLAAKREAFLKPRVIREFLTQYDGSPLPREDIAQNVLEEMGVPTDKLSTVFAFIVEGAKDLRLVEEIKGKQYVALDGMADIQVEKEHTAPVDGSTELKPQSVHEGPAASAPSPASVRPSNVLSSVQRRVFVTHGKNKTFIDPIKKLLGFGELEPVVSVEKQSVSQPVPDKVMSDMRTCGAAIIHVEDEMHLLDKTATEHVVLNPNVLIEIGAAMALYGRRFILLVKDGVKLPSNLQGLYEVRYIGDTLDGDATIRLLEAINAMKNHAGPEKDQNSSG